VSAPRIRAPRARRRWRRRTKILVAIAATLSAVVAAGGIWYYFVFEPPAPPVADGKRHVAAVGDSNTYGAGVLFGHRTENSYPDQLQKLLGEDYQVLNYGLSGRTLLSTGDSPYNDNKFWSISHDVEPDVVLIMLGTNDTKPQNWDAQAYEQQLAEVVTSYTDLLNKPDVYLLTPPAAYENTFGIDPGIVRDEVVPIVNRVAAELQVPVIDVFTATRGEQQLFSDGVHPDAAGYGIIARTVAGALAASFAR
jgi:acyl-CoA thioesterase I